MQPETSLSIASVCRPLLIHLYKYSGSSFTGQTLLHSPQFMQTSDGKNFCSFFNGNAFRPLRLAAGANTARLVFMTGSSSTAARPNSGEPITAKS
jgi:hypothetical protein